MIDLILLVAIAILIARLIWKTFQKLEQLAAYIRSLKSSRTLLFRDINPQQQQNYLRSQKDKRKRGKEANYRSSVGKSQQKKVDPSRLLRKEQGRVQNMQCIQQLQSKVEKVISQKCYQSAVKTEEPQKLQMESKIQEYQSVISSLRQEIATHQQEKQLYIMRIEEIIQQVMNRTENQPQQNRNSSEENQLATINHLKHQFNAANHQIQEKKQQLTLIFQQQKQQLIADYQQRLQQLQDDFNRKTELYQITINEVTQKICIMQNFQRQQDISPQQLQYNVQQAERMNQQNKEIQQLMREISQLKMTSMRDSNMYSQEIKSLKEQIMQTRESLKCANQQLRQKQTILSTLQKSYKDNKVGLNQQKLNNQSIKLENASLKQRIMILEKKLSKEAQHQQQISTKLQQTQLQLKICQQKLKNIQDHDYQWKGKVKTVIDSASNKQKSIKKEGSQHSAHKSKIAKDFWPYNLKIKYRQKQDRASKSNKIQRTSEKQREVSPTFGDINAPPQRQTSASFSQIKSKNSLGPFSKPTPNKMHSKTSISQFLALKDKMVINPAQKSVVYSTIMEGGILGQIYLGESAILNEKQRNFIIRQVSAVKKITVKKTRLMYSSKQYSNKSILQYVLGAPNIILVAELKNTKIVGAFSQNAFSKVNRASSLGKAIIFDVSSQVYITNEGTGQVIRCQQTALIWGNNEFVVNCVDPISIEADLNCKYCSYPCNYQSSKFLSCKQKTIRVTKLQVHRVFLG